MSLSRVRGGRKARSEQWDGCIDSCCAAAGRADVRPKQRLCRAGNRRHRPSLAPGRRRWTESGWGRRTECLRKGRNVPLCLQSIGLQSLAFSGLALCEVRDEDPLPLEGGRAGFGVAPRRRCCAENQHPGGPTLLPRRSPTLIRPCSAGPPSPLQREGFQASPRLPSRREQPGSTGDRLAPVRRDPPCSPRYFVAGSNGLDAGSMVIDPATGPLASLERLPIRHPRNAVRAGPGVTRTSPPLANPTARPCLAARQT